MQDVSPPIGPFLGGGLASKELTFADLPPLSLSLNSSRSSITKKLLTWLLLLVVLLVPNSVSATPIIYDIGTINFPGGHTATGSITTNGTLGPLAIADITSWTITVIGPMPFLFTDASPLSNLGTTDTLSASATELSTAGAFRVSDRDNSLPECSDCVQVIGWGSSVHGDGYIYLFREAFDPDPSVIDVLPAPIHPIVIGVAVPEPATAGLLALGLACLFAARSRKIGR